MNENSASTDWLLEGPAWVRYATRRHLLRQSEDDPLTKAERAAMLADPQVKALVAELAGWHGTVVKSHKNAAHPLHQLAFLADIGAARFGTARPVAISTAAANRSTGH